MASIQLIRASSSGGPAALATVQSQRSSSSLTISVDTVSNFNTGGFIATTGSPKNIALTSGENLLVLENPMVFKGHVDSGNIIIDEVVNGYADNGNNIGDVVIVKPTSAWADEIADVLSVSHTDSGALKQVDGNEPGLKLAVQSAQPAPDPDGNIILWFEPL